MAQQLNIAEDEPEEYEGRLVTVNGAEYTIGRWVGEGAERIVHDLVGRRTGLSLHLINILRDQAIAATTAAVAREVTGKFRGDFADLQFVRGIDEALVVHGHGGVFEVQEAMSTEPGLNGVRYAQIKQAVDRGDWDECAVLSEQILTTHPEHVLALHMLAHAYAERGRHMEAAELEQVAIDVEPNLRPPRRIYLRCLAAIGARHTFVDAFEDFKAKWPTDDRADPLAAEVYLALGLPEVAMALSLRKVSPEVTKQIQREVKAKNRGRSHLAAAAKALKAGRVARSDRELRRGYKSYPKDIDITFNWGLALLRNGDAKQAHSVIAGIAQTVPPDLRTQCFGTLGFAAVIGGEDDRAVTMLELVVKILEKEGPLVIWDLPLWAAWVNGDEVYGEQSTRASDIVNALVRRLQARGTVPPALVRLAEAYERGMADFLPAAGHD